jgi:VanZ family protein
LRRYRVVLPLCCVAFVLVLTHLPPNAIPRSLPGVLMANGMDKVEHCGAYGLITLCVLFAAQWRLDRRVWMIVLAIAALGIADEVTQPLFGRDCSGWDWTADLAGITSACVVAFLSRRGGRRAEEAEAGNSSVLPVAPGEVVSRGADLWSERAGDRAAKWEPQE